jgi:hypothetical protein
MHTEWTDAELETWWEAHLQGRPLPPRMTAHQTVWGPRLLIGDRPVQAIWTRAATPRAGRFWHKIIVLR